MARGHRRRRSQQLREAALWGPVAALFVVLALWWAGQPWTVAVTWGLGLFGLELVAWTALRTGLVSSRHLDGAPGRRGGHGGGST